MKAAGVSLPSGQSCLNPLYHSLMVPSSYLVFDLKNSRSSLLSRSPRDDLFPISAPQIDCSHLRLKWLSRRARATLTATVWGCKLFTRAGPQSKNLSDQQNTPDPTGSVHKKARGKNWPKQQWFWLGGMYLKKCPLLVGKWGQNMKKKKSQSLSFEIRFVFLRCLFGGFGS